MLVLGSFPDLDLSCCYQILQLEVWKLAKSTKNSAIFTRSPVRPPNLESLPSPCDYILHTWLAPAWEKCLLLDLCSVQMPVLTRAKFTFGFEHGCSGTGTPPILNAFTSAWGEKDRALFPLPPAFNFLAAHSFKKWIAGIW